MENALNDPLVALDLHFEGLPLAMPCEQRIAISPQAEFGVVGPWHAFLNTCGDCEGDGMKKEARRAASE
jgi:hypothetical protein